MQLSFIKPLDQPPGARRLLAELKVALMDDRFSEFRLIVAYAKSGPLYRLRELLEQWREKGNRIEAILGIDQQGTSREALELSLALFHSVYVTRESGVTFHPKIYLFKGETAARAFIGSNNLTVGGTEKNFEAAVQLDLSLPDEAEILAKLEEGWTSLLPPSCPATTRLDQSLLVQLIANGDVIDERAMRPGDADPEGARTAVTRKPVRSGLVVKPESPLPKNALASARRQRAGDISVTAIPVRTVRGTETSASATLSIPSATPATAQGLAIQIKPHHNGEIFLSVTAAFQNPAFFHWPFTGRTTPKKPGNPSYPQLEPDPVVNITVYDTLPFPLLTLSAYRLNTVYYEKNSEIRITAAPLVGIVPDYSVMIMRLGESPGIDYEITIHTPKSPEYSGWVAACNQSMPSGGKAPRKYGWF